MGFKEELIKSYDKLAHVGGIFFLTALPFFAYLTGASLLTSILIAAISWRSARLYYRVLRLLTYLKPEHFKQGE